MTGFIKPGEIYEAQSTIIGLLRENDKDLKDLDEEVREFLQINPVTKEKSGGKFRYVDGVWVSEEGYEDADSLRRPIDDVVFD